MYNLLCKQILSRMCQQKSILYFCTRSFDCELLKKHLNPDSSILTKFYKILKRTGTPNISELKVMRNCKILKDMNVSLDYIEYLTYCLNLQPIILRNRIAILNELGVKFVNLMHIYRFPEGMKRTLKSFKLIYDIPLDVDIRQNLINCMNETGKITHKEILYSIDPPCKITDHIQTGLYFQTFMLYYMSVYLHIHTTSFFKNNRLKYRSIKEVYRIVEVLKTKCHFDNDFIQKNVHLVWLNPDNILDFLSECQDMHCNNINIYDFIKRYPNILTADAFKTKELLNLYNMLGIPAQAPSIYPLALKMKKDIFLKRYMKIGDLNELKLWLQHRRVLSMIYCYNAVIARANYLRIVNATSNANINTLLSTKSYFARFSEGEVYYTALKKHLRYLVTKELGKDKIDLVDDIVKHPYWKYISLIHINNMLEYLKKYYSIDDICANIQIVLYPKYNVVRLLQSLHAKYSIKDGYKFTSAQYLALCLYKLEQKHHFSGDGVWQKLDSQMDNSEISENVTQNNSDALVDYVHENEIFAVSGTAWLEYLLR